MVQSYEVRVLGPLPEKVCRLLGPAVVGEAETRTVLGTRAADPAAVASAISRVADLGLELTELRRDRDHTELEVSGLLGPTLQAALADVVGFMVRRRSVLCLRTPARTLAAALQVLTQQGVDLLSIRVAPA